jgi:hypothetical protein
VAKNNARRFVGALLWGVEMNAAKSRNDVVNEAAVWMTAVTFMQSGVAQMTAKPPDHLEGGPVNDVLIINFSERFADGRPDHGF